MILADFASGFVLNLGWGELGLLAMVTLLPFILIVYCVYDIVKSNFRFEPTKWLFLLLVIFAPFVGSIIYLFLRKNYVKPKKIGSRYR